MRGYGALWLHVKECISINDLKETLNKIEGKELVEVLVDDDGYIVIWKSEMKKDYRSK